ncbi:NAD(P)/FAD-dependent oxidoreductase [Planococcus plakortidis]|uniref:NAD(P)/FAD-dependent oxidoreductase n=1 Tax=Planococcus plakortidis TaxID=1038856 RepID=UPI003859EDE7
MKSMIIIGSGIVGASATYYAAKAGNHVTLIDRADRGQATGAAAGIVCPWISQRRNQAWYRLASNGAAYYPVLIKELEALGEKETGYKQVGIVSIHEESKLDKMEQKARERQAGSPEMGELERLTPEQTKARFPYAGDRYGSLYVSGAARVDGGAIRDALIRSAKQLGAKFIQGDAKLLIEAGQATGVEVNGESLAADRIISAGGAWAAELFKPLGLHLKVVPQKAQILHLQSADTGTGDWPVAMVPFGQYIVPFEDGRIVAGATHENNAGFDDKLTAGGIFHILEKTLDVAPGLAAAEFTGAATGFRPATLSALPFIGQVPGQAQLFAANALGASGLTAGPYLGMQLAKLATGETTDLDIGLYDIEEAFEEIK